MRYKLIPARGREAWHPRACYVDQDIHAINYAEGLSEELKMKVLVVDELFRVVGLFGAEPEPPKVKRGNR